MINVSSEFQKLMNERTDFKQNAEITLQDGTVLILDETDFTVSNNHVIDGSESGGIPLGVAVCRSIQIELMNDTDKFSQYDFFGAKINLVLNFELSATTEKINYGSFTVLTPETFGATIIITALDDMYKADAEYISELVFPASVKDIYFDICEKMGVVPGTSSFLNDSFIVNTAPAGYTMRQILGYISMIAGGNARIDLNGRLCIMSYDFTEMKKLYASILNGGSYLPWDNPVNVDGGTFSPWDSGDNVDGGTFGDRIHYHILGNWKDLKVDTDDIVITGLSTEKEEAEETLLYGSEGYVLKIENPLIVGSEENALQIIGEIMVGVQFRQFSGDMIANPTLEFMDPVLIMDRKGNVYISFVTDVDFSFFGFTTVKNSAQPVLRNGAKTYSESTKTLVKARKLIAEERTAREQAVAQLAKDLKNSSGLFMTEDVQPDGSTIYYMHDKPTLAESMVVWKLTALAFGISTDGGKTYPYGFTVDGTTITRLLYTEGINADYINSGSLSADRIKGGTLALGGKNNIDGIIKMYNSNGAEVGSWTNNSFKIQNGSTLLDFANNKLVIGNIKVDNGFYINNEKYGSPKLIGEGSLTVPASYYGMADVAISIEEEIFYKFSSIQIVLVNGLHRRDQKLMLLSVIDPKGIVATQTARQPSYELDTNAFTPAQSMSLALWDYYEANKITFYFSATNANISSSQTQEKTHIYIYGIV